MHITVEDPQLPEILALLRDGEACSASLYPPEGNHHLPLKALRAPEVLFHVARDPSRRALGTGAVVLNGDWAEIKRMWVAPDAWGRGAARALLAAMEAAAEAQGVRILRLETGVKNDTALALYAPVGFSARGPFGNYGLDPLSVFMEKSLVTS